MPAAFDIYDRMTEISKTVGNRNSTQNSALTFTKTPASKRKMYITEIYKLLAPHATNQNATANMQRHTSMVAVFLLHASAQQTNIHTYK